MKQNEVIYLPFTGIEFTVTDRMQELETECLRLLDKLNPVISFGVKMKLEAELSASISNNYKDYAYAFENARFDECILEALNFQFKSPSTSVQAVANTWALLTSNRDCKFKHKPNTLDKIQRILKDTDNVIFTKYPIVGAAFAHLAFSSVAPYIDANCALARIMLYVALASKHPTVWNCSISHAIKCYNQMLYCSALTTTPTFAIESLMKLIYAALCYAYIEQEVGDSWKSNTDDITVFLYHNCNIGHIDDLIKVIKEDSNNVCSL